MIVGIDAELTVRHRRHFWNRAGVRCGGEA
jgi:hypothetical protein